jgi:hypothetical protein
VFLERKDDPLCRSANARFGCQKVRFGDVRDISALPLKADIRRKCRHISNVPKPEITPTLSR